MSGRTLKAFPMPITTQLWCYELAIDFDVEHDEIEGELPEGAIRFMRAGKVEFVLPSGMDATLTLFWIQGYGGGIFLPFRDATNGSRTYGGGRYLLDTIKGADLGITAETVVLDFNFAYHPSCYYNPKYTCPLAPMENRLQFPVPVGEMSS